MTQTRALKQATPAVDAGFWDRIAPKYAKKAVPNEEAYRVTLERVAAHLTTRDRVLELGCGTGTTALKLAPFASSITASDVSSEMIRIATHKAEAAQIHNVNFHTGTVDDIALSSEPFDVVMAFNLIHLLPDIPAACQRIHALLKPGGLFISKTPCIGESSILLRGLIPLMRVFGQAPFVNFVKRDRLHADIAGADFEILEQDMLPKKSHSSFVVARRAAHRNAPPHSAASGAR